MGTSHLKENELRLYRQKISRVQGISKSELRAQLAQHENKTVPGTSSSLTIFTYYLGKSFYKKEKKQQKLEKVIARLDAKIDSAKSQRKINSLQYKKQQRTEKLRRKVEQGNTFMQWGEPVVVFDSAKVEQSNEAIQAYLFSRGYFNSHLSASVDKRGKTKLVGVSYDIQPGIPYTLDSIFYHANDARVDSLLRLHRPNSIIRRGQLYNEQHLSEERDRLDLLLRDNGYYDFSRQYIQFNIDTTFHHDHKIALMVDVKDPIRGSHHNVFRIDSIIFTTDANVTIQGTRRQHLKYGDITFRFFENNYSPKILSQRVFIHPGLVYSRTRTFNTQRQLANLDAFRFVNVNYDTSGGTFITNIFTSPLNRYQWSNEVGVNVTEGYPGPFYSVNFKKRNLFGGLENFDFNGRIGFEGVASATKSQNAYRSIEGSVNGTITFPQFIFPLSHDTQIRFANYNPRTKALVGYNYTNRPEYSRANTNASFTYLWETRRTTQMFLTLTSLNVINTTVKTSNFQAFLDAQDSLGNRSLASSFRPSFVSSMLFGITWNHDNYGNRETNSAYIRTQIESGGTSLNFLGTEDITNRGLEYFKYLRLSFDVRQSIVLNPGTILAYRFNSGIAYPYGKNKTLPYEKFFFAGGSSSVRAWRPRRLGPGSLPPPQSQAPSDDGYFDYSYESPGEILLEGSVELRQELFGIFDGAVFVDAGNSWWFDELARPAGINYGNSRFRLDRFFREFGVGTGFGLRLDFTFLVLRLDVGIKVYDPARPPGDRFVLDDLRFLRPFGIEKEPVIYNVAIGFPF